jgi:hypothetical protein
MLPEITVPFVLVSGDADDEIPTDLERSGVDVERLLGDERLLHWFAQNCVLTHKKITRMPIGIDYHTLSNPPRIPHPWGPVKTSAVQEREIRAIRDRGGPWRKRASMCYGNFFPSGRKRHDRDRVNARNQIPAALWRRESRPVPRARSHANQAECIFVASPHGHGLDCHRTWEALVLGCIPIVRTSLLDPLYDGLPVWIVDEWSDVTREAMERTVSAFENREFLMEKLLTSHWQKLFVEAGT